MSREQEWVLRESTLAHNKRDVEGIVSKAHPEIEIRLIGGLSDLFGQPGDGHEGLRSYFTDWFTTFKPVQLEHKRLFEVGEQLVTLTELTATIKGSSVSLDLLTGQIWGFKDWKISRWYVYRDPVEAFSSVGLPGFRRSTEPAQEHLPAGALLESPAALSRTV